MRSIKGGDLFEMVKVLTAQDMDGHLSGHKGYDKAAKWVAAQFKKWGLRPVYGKSFLQPFELSYNEMRETTFSLILPPQSKGEQPRVAEMKIYKDFCPTLYSGYGEMEAEVVFVGFGLTAPELGWDDYRGMEVEGKIVATLHGTPRIKGKDFPSKPIMMSNHDINGDGTALYISGGKDYPELFEMLLQANEIYRINQSIEAGGIRAMGAGSDYAPFVEKDIPTYSTWARGGGRRNVTHTAGDSIYVITPKIMEDIVRLYFAAGYEFLNK